METLVDCCVKSLNHLTYNLKGKIMESYGMELILDLHKCDVSLFKRKHLKKYINELCELIDMQPMKLTWWDYFWTPERFRTKDPKLYGTSVVQFIMTSNITIHTLDKLGTVYLNIFSCKEFKAYQVADFTTKWFSGKLVHTYTIIPRG